MTTFSVYPNVYDCANCGARYFHRAMSSFSTFHNAQYFDGYQDNVFSVYASNAYECTKCHHAVAANELVAINLPPSELFDNPQVLEQQGESRLSLKPKFKYHEMAHPSIDYYLEKLPRQFNSRQEEINKRLEIVWQVNHFQLTSDCDKTKRLSANQARLDDNFEKLCELLDGNDRSLIIKADLLRQNGEFARAKETLKPIDRSHYPEAAAIFCLSRQEITKPWHYHRPLNSQVQGCSHDEIRWVKQQREESKDNGYSDFDYSFGPEIDRLTFNHSYSISQLAKAKLLLGIVILAIFFLLFFD